MKIFHILILFVFFLRADITFAQTPQQQAPTVAIPQEYIDMMRTNTIRDQLLVEADSKIALVSMVKAKINAMSLLSPSQKAALTSEIANKLNTIKTIRDKTATAKNTQSMNSEKAQLRALNNATLFYLSKINLMAFADKAIKLASEIKSTSRNIGALAKISHAQTTSQAMFNRVEKLSIDGFPGNREVMSNERSNVRIILQDLKEARNLTK